MLEEVDTAELDWEVEVDLAVESVWEDLEAASEVVVVVEPVLDAAEPVAVIPTALKELPSVWKASKKEDTLETYEESSSPDEGTLSRTVTMSSAVPAMQLTIPTISPRSPPPLLQPSEPPSELDSRALGALSESSMSSATGMTRFTILATSDAFTESLSFIHFLTTGYDSFTSL